MVRQTLGAALAVLLLAGAARAASYYATGDFQGSDFDTGATYSASGPVRFALSFTADRLEPNRVEGSMSHLTPFSISGTEMTLANTGFTVVGAPVLTNRLALVLYGQMLGGAIGSNTVDFQVTFGADGGVLPDFGDTITMPVAALFLTNPGVTGVGQALQFSGVVRILNTDTGVVPVPASMPLILVAFGGLALARRRR